MKKIRWSRLIMRLFLFILVAFGYFFRGNLGILVLQTPFREKLTRLHLVWLVLMAEMAAQILPNKRAGMEHNKQFKKYYSPPPEPVDPDALQREKRERGKEAGRVLLVWLLLVCVLLVLYFREKIAEDEVLLVSAALYLCDGICMEVWCPLQGLFMSSGRCCVGCRIYGWGFFLVYGFLAVIPSVFTYSLAGLSLLLLARWEVRCARHPERFWSGSNLSLRCGSCGESPCRAKWTLASALAKKKKLLKS